MCSVVTGANGWNRQPRENISGGKKEYEERNMEDIDLKLAIEALGYGTENMELNKYYEYHRNIVQDTFRRTQKDLEGVGSLYEGIECGFCCRDLERRNDEDRVLNKNEFTISINKTDGSISGHATINAENDLLIKSCKEFPGYVILKVKKPIFGCNILLNNSCTPLFRTEIRLPNNQHTQKKNGPALSEYSEFGNHIIKTDNVCCIAYKSWPVEANKWVSRNKPNNWPSKELIETIKSKGFNLAPVGHYDCKYKNNQFRIGIRGEKELLSNLNETQILCYVALRLILKDDIQLIDEDVLSSYHMKNVVFWCAEQESCQWSKQNFAICLKTCINRLKTFIKHGKFPHYFVEDRNLINSKMTLELKTKIIKALTKYSSDVLAILSLRSFEKTDLKITSLKCAKLRRIILKYIMFHTIIVDYFCFNQHSLWETYKGHNTTINLQNAQDILSILKNTKRNLFPPYIEYAKNMLGMLYYSKYHETRCKQDNLKAWKLLRSSLKFEHVSLKFRVATFFFMENEFDECLGVCNAYFNNPRKYETIEEKVWHSDNFFNEDINRLLEMCPDDLTNLTEYKEKISTIFHDACIFEKCGDGRLTQAKTVLLQIRFLRSKSNVDDVQEILLDLFDKYKTPYGALLILFEHLPNLLFCDMSFNVPFLASEKWAVPDVIQYELLSVKECHPESSIYGIYIDPMLTCLVLSFLSYNGTNNLTQRDMMLTKLHQYINKYSYNEQSVSPELPHSLPLYRVYNIVAYCFLKAGRYQLALEYILNSFELHKNAENTAYGYIRCVRLYGKGHIMYASLPQDVLDDEIFEKFSVDCDKDSTKRERIATQKKTN